MIFFKQSSIARFTKQCSVALLLALPLAASAGSADTEETRTDKAHTEKAQLAFTPSQLTYSASYNGMPIQVTRSLQQDADGIYTLNSYAKSFFGSINESGQFKLPADTPPITNLNYSYTRNIFGKKKQEQLLFDYTNQVANYTKKDKHRQVTLDGDYETRLSYQLRLQLDLLNGREEFNYPVIARGRLKQYRFEKTAKEMLDTPLGKLNTVKLSRTREDSERQTTLWFAPELNYLLVKLVQVEKDGQDYQITLSNGQIDGIPLTDYLADNSPQQPQKAP